MGRSRTPAGLWSQNATFPLHWHYCTGVSSSFSPFGRSCLGRKRQKPITTSCYCNVIIYLNFYFEIKNYNVGTVLVQDSQKYEYWKHWGYKNLLETLEEFPSVSIDAAVLISQLPLTQPRFYSISSSPLDNPNQVDITAAVVEFKTEGIT